MGQDHATAPNAAGQQVQGFQDGVKHGQLHLGAKSGEGGRPCSKVQSIEVANKL